MAYGDAEHPISFRLEPRREGVHVKVTVRCGIAGSRALCGELTLRPEEWAMLRLILGTAPFPPPDDADRMITQAVQMYAPGMSVKLITMEPIEFGSFTDAWPEFEARMAAFVSESVRPPS